MGDTFRRGFIYRFTLRWFVCSVGIWIAAGFLGNVDVDHRVTVVLVAGGILAVLNAVLKPLLVVLSVPAILLTMGLFMVIINGVTVYLAGKLYSPLHITDFGTAMITGIIIGFVNYLVTAILEPS